MIQRHIVLGVVLLMLCPSFLRAQGRELKGQVLSIGAQNEEIPEVNVTIRIEGAGIPDYTNTYGEFRLFLPDIFKAGETVPLAVNKPGWCILDPLDGEARIPTNLPKDRVQVRLVPMAVAALQRRGRRRPQCHACGLGKNPSGLSLLSPDPLARIIHESQTRPWDSLHNVLSISAND